MGSVLEFFLASPVLRSVFSLWRRGSIWRGAFCIYSGLCWRFAATIEEVTAEWGQSLSRTWQRRY